MRVTLQSHNLRANISSKSNPPREPPGPWEAETIIRIFLILREANIRESGAQEWKNPYCNRGKELSLSIIFNSANFQNIFEIICIPSV